MPETATSGAGNYFTRKLGPLPVWAWAALLAGLILGYMYWKKIGPFAGADSVDASSGYPAVDPSSLASMLGAGGGANLGSVAGGGPANPPGWIGSSDGGTVVGSAPGVPLNLNQYGVLPADWKSAGEHQKELWKLHPPVYPGQTAGVR